jgi:hypothetical protein
MVERMQCNACEERDKSQTALLAPALCEVAAAAAEQVVEGCSAPGVAALQHPPLQGYRALLLLLLLHPPLQGQWPLLLLLLLTWGSFTMVDPAMMPYPRPWCGIQAYTKETANQLSSVTEAQLQAAAADLHA